MKNLKRVLIGSAAALSVAAALAASNAMAAPEHVKAGGQQQHDRASPRRGG